ncbi:MAG: glycosyltransferase, partial [Clostridia bacterium]|nr:glycosyltransferase [Clostridia bacterium]
MKKIVFTGGGTAGHVMPNLALIPYLNNYEIFYIGGSGIEKDIIKKQSNITYF